jgi:hypothetical protein
MIRFLLLQNRAGKTRLAKYYVPLGDQEKRKLEYDVHRMIVTRDPKHTNFAEVRYYPPKQLLLQAAANSLSGASTACSWFKSWYVAISMGMWKRWHARQLHTCMAAAERARSTVELSSVPASTAVAIAPP